MPDWITRLMNTINIRRWSSLPDQVFKRLTPNQKRILKRLIPRSQSRRLYSMLAVKQIETLRQKLLNLGFTDKAIQELENIVKYDQHPLKRRFAAKELVLWHANQYNETSAEKCLELLQIVRENERNPDDLRQIAIMEAECLAILDRVDEARTCILHILERQRHSDLYLAMSNLSRTNEEKIEWINKALAHNDISPITLMSEGEENSLYDCLKSYPNEKHIKSGPKVSIIMPVYNAEAVIRTALDSLISQTWCNIEILIVDDHSSDNTIDIIRDYQRKDSRIQLLQTDKNSGPYVARNIALQVATGEYVTCHDADDWSHCEKIERQVMHLEQHQNLIGNTSLQARMTNDLMFYRRGNFGYYIFSNMSSFMFRRKPIVEKIGYWDSVRIGADSEFIRRIKVVFGDNSIAKVPNSLLSFQRQSMDSLTGNEYFGFHGYFMGARREYFESSQQYHAQSSDELKYEFPMESRPFSVPNPLLPGKRENERRHYDVIIVSDFRLDGGSTLSSIEEVKAQYKMGLKTGLIQMYRYDYESMKPLNRKVRELLNHNYAELITYGEKVSCDVLIIRYPPILQEKQRYIPEVKAEHICVIVNQTPLSNYGSNGEVRYDFQRCATHLSEWVGTHHVWYPIGPLIREALIRHHTEELKGIKLANEDWVNIINIEEWWTERQPLTGRKPIIGRHSRDEAMKWPATKEEILSIYPNKKHLDVHILGGATVPAQIIGRLPSNWKVYDFGEIDPKIFLASLDIFVYFTHPDWVESFGRVIIEAMASGLPVILPKEYQLLFGEAAIYAEANDVMLEIERLANDPSYYNNRINIQKEYIEQRFGYTSHYLRLKELLPVKA